MSCEKYLHHRTLIAGEVNSGKTERTLRIVRDLLACQHEGVGILDLAPEMIQGVGGKLPLTPQEKEKVLYLSPRIVAPRISGRTDEEIHRLALENRQRIEEALKILSEKSVPILIINDVSLYFHEGKAEALISSIQEIPTLIINGYYGKYFGEGDLSRKERAQMEALMAHCDQVFFLPARPPLPS